MWLEWRVIIGSDGSGGYSRKWETVWESWGRLKLHFEYFYVKVWHDQVLKLGGWLWRRMEIQSDKAPGWELFSKPVLNRRYSLTVINGVGGDPDETDSWWYVGGEGNEVKGGAQTWTTGWMVVPFTEIRKHPRAEGWGENTELNFVIEFEMCCPIIDVW